MVLASGSPRRAELLRRAGLVFRVVAPRAEEPRYEGGLPRSYAMRVAHLKAREVAEALGSGLVVGADTIVIWHGEVFGKPATREEARSMLQRLSGDHHEVLTAVEVIDAATGRAIGASDRANLQFRALDDAEIEHYLDSGEPMDKAGAYALQGEAGRFVTALDGDPETVIGLPTRLVRALLERVRQQ